MNQETTRLGTAPITRLLIRFAIPSILTFLGFAIYSATDRFFVGQALGDLGIAALGVVSPLFLIMITIGILCGTGGNTMFSMRLGSNEPEKANRIFRNTVWLQLILSAAYITTVSIFMTDILIACGASEQTLPLAKQYLTFLLFGMTFDATAESLNNFTRSIGRPTRAMINAMSGVAVNVVLDYVFIMQMDMGMQGAGLATAIGMMFAAFMTITSFNKSVVKFKIRKPKLSTMIKICKFGASPFLVHISIAFYALIINGIMAKNGGDYAIAAWSIAIMIEQFFIMPTFGFTTAMQSIVGYNWGAKKFERVKNTLTQTLKIAETIMIAAGLGIFLLGAQIAGVFGGTESANLAAQFLKIFVISYPAVTAVFTFGIYMNATGYYKRAVVLNFFRMLGFLIPFVIVFSELWGIKGVMIAIPLANYISGALAVALMVKPWKNLISHTRPSLPKV